MIAANKTLSCLYVSQYIHTTSMKPVLYVIIALLAYLRMETLANLL